MEEGRRHAGDAEPIWEEETILREVRWEMSRGDDFMSDSNSTLKEGAAIALIIFAMLIGFGVCLYLGDLGIAKRIEAETKAKSAENYK